MRIPNNMVYTRACPRCRAAAWAIAGLISWSLLTDAGVRAQQTEFEGQPVAEIRVVDEAGKVIPEKTPPLPLEAGKKFDFGAERESVRALYRTGDYSDIRVTAAQETGGLRVDFVVRRNYFNNVVKVEGVKEPPTEPATLAALRMNLGEPFRESALKEGIERLEQALHEDGLYQAKVTWAVVPIEETRQMDITVAVDPGPRAHVGDLIIKNQTKYPEKELRRRAKLTSKNELTQARLTRTEQRLKKFLVDQGYLGASAVLTPGTYDPATNLVQLTMNVTAGPQVRVEVNGAHLSQAKLRKLLPIYAEGAVDEDLVQEGRRNIRDYFQREGYCDADVQVNSRIDKSQNERVVSFEISRGERFKVVGVKFEGNKYFSNRLLSVRLAIQPAAFASSGRFSQQLVRDDADSIRGLYTSNGFSDAQVTSDVDDNYNGKKGSLFVRFHIVEGQQTRVKSLEIEGNHALSKEALLAVTGSTPGQAYSEADIARDRNNILATYFNDGYPEAHFTDEVVKGEAANQVRLIYHITEGTRIDVSKVLLTGYQFTRPEIIARDVLIKPGGPLREGDVVESQRQLYNLGVFNRVQIAPQNPNGTDPDKVMVVDAQEGKRYTLGYGFGFEVQRIGANCTAPSGNQPTTCSPNSTKIASSPRGIFEISRSNMFGRAQTLSFKARASTLEYRSVLAYTADHLFANKNLSLQLTGFADKSQDVNTFTSTRFEGSLQVTDALSHGSSISARYFYRRVKASNINETINVEQIPLFSLPTLVSGVGVNYARDRRDNPADATRGTFNTIDLSVAADALGSSASFFRGYYQNSSFHTFGRAFVFARSVPFGFEERR